MNNLLTSNVRSFRENLKPLPCRIDLTIGKVSVSVWGFPIKTSLSVNK